MTDTDYEVPDMEAAFTFATEEVAGDPAPPTAAGVLEGDSPLEFTLDDRAEAAQLAGMSFMSLLVAYIDRNAGVDFSQAGTDISQWKAPQLVQFATLLAPFSERLTKDVQVGELDPAQVKAATLFSAQTIKCALTMEKERLTVSHTGETLLANILGHKGVTARWEADPKFSDAWVVLDVPGYDGPDREKIRVGHRGDYWQRVVHGAKTYCEWHNMEFKTNFKYVETHPINIALAMLMTHRLKIVLKEEGKEIGFVDRKYSTPKMSVGKMIDISSFIKATLPLIQKAYRNVKLRPSWAVSGKHQLQVFEHYLTVVYGAKLKDPAYRAMMEKFVGDIRRKTLDGEAALRIKHGDVLGAALGPALKLLCSGKWRGPNIGVDVKTYKQVSDIVETSRREERNTGNGGDFTTKLDGPAFSSSLRARGTVAAKWQNALKSLAMFYNTKAPVDVVGLGKGCHFQAEVMKHFDNNELSYSDIQSGYAPPLRGKFTARNVLMKDDFPTDSGKGKILVSDVFPGKDIKDADFRTMVTNYFGCKYDAGIFKMALGSNADDTTPLDGKTCPSYLVEWILNYEVVYLCQGGGPHSQEYFVVFAHPKIVKGKDGRLIPRDPSMVTHQIYSPPKPIIGSPKPLHLGVETIESENQRTAQIMLYVCQWLTLKSLDMVRMNAIKSAWCWQGQRFPSVPDPANGGPFLGWNSVNKSSVLRFSGPGTEKATTTGDVPAPARVFDDNAFADII